MTDSGGLWDLLPADHPAEFDTLSARERCWRLRLYLATWAIGASMELS